MPPALAPGSPVASVLWGSEFGCFLLQNVSVWTRFPPSGVSELSVREGLELAEGLNDLGVWSFLAMHWARGFVKGLFGTGSM